MAIVTDSNFSRYRDDPKADEITRDNAEHMVIASRVVPTSLRYKSHEEFMNAAFNTYKGCRPQHYMFLLVAERTLTAKRRVCRIEQCAGVQHTARDAMELADWCGFSGEYRWVRVYHIYFGQTPRLIYSPQTRIEAPEEYEDYNPDS